jgi:enoyl-CoA hydratase/carnithine racemase
MTRARGVLPPPRGAADGLGTVRLPRLIGHGRAMDLLLTGRAVGAAAGALAIGLVDWVLPDGSARRRAVELAALPQACLRNDRLSRSSNGHGGAGGDG